MKIGQISCDFNKRTILAHFFGSTSRLIKYHRVILLVATIVPVFALSLILYFSNRNLQKLFIILTTICIQKIEHTPLKLLQHREAEHVKSNSKRGLYERGPKAI